MENINEDILMVKSAICLILAGLSAKHPDLEIEEQPKILEEIAQDYKNEIKKQLKDFK